MQILIPILIISFFLLVGLCVGVIALILTKGRQQRGLCESHKPGPAELTTTRNAPAPTAYEAEPSLVTAAERSFFGVLHQALGVEYHICPKVRLADIIRPAKQPSRSGWQTAFNRIASKHVDFAICDPVDLAVLGIVELDDRTHLRFDRSLRDGAVDAALSSAGIPVIRVPARQFYSQPDLKSQVVNCLRRSSAAAPSP